MLDSRPDAFDDRNLFFHALLGLAAAGEQLDRALAVAAPDGEATVPPDHPWLLCLLGAVAFRQRLAAIVASAVPDRADAAGDPGAERAPLRELLR